MMTASHVLTRHAHFFFLSVFTYLIDCLIVPDRVRAVTIDHMHQHSAPLHVPQES